MVETILTFLFMIVVPGGIPIIIAWRAWKVKKRRDKIFADHAKATDKLIKTCDKIINKKDKKDED